MKKLTQILSITLSSALVLTSAPWPVSAIGPVAEMPAFAQALAPAESLGYVATSYSPSSDVTRPRLIVIADLHAHVEVQHHIVDMLDGLVNKLTTGPVAQKQVQIFVEGGWESHLEHPLKSVQNPKLRSIMAEYFLQKAEIPATQAFSERHPNATNFTLTGVENKDEYEANRARFLSSYPVRKRLLEAIARHEDSLKDLSGSVEARSYQKMQDMRQAYQTGTLSGEKYAHALVHQASRFNIENRYVDILRGSNATANAEFDLALTEVSRVVSVKLSESRPISAIFRGDEKTVRANIATVDAYLDLLKRTLGNQLTPEEVPFAYARIPQMTQVAKILLSSETLNIDVANALQQALAFYPFAFMRNDSIVQNSLSTLQKGSPNDTGILVVGGFHSEAIGQYLQEHQIPYVLINPVVSRDLSTVEQLNYVERMAGDHVTATEARADFSHPFGQAIVTRSATSVTPISDIATPASADAPTAAVEGEINPDGTPKIGGLTGGNPIFAILGTQLGQNAITSLASGITSTQPSERVDYLGQLAKNLNLPVEATVDPTKGATFVNKGGYYESTEAAGTQFSPLLDIVLKSIPEPEQIRPKTIDFQPVSGDVLFRYQTNSTGKTNVDAQSFVVLGLGTDRQVILFNQDQTPNLLAAQQAISTLQKNGNPSQADEAALNNLTAIAHELTHVFTREGQEGSVGERYVQAQALNSLLYVVAQQASRSAVEHAASAGMTATSVETALVQKVLLLVPNHIPSTVQGQLAQNIQAASQNGSVSLTSLRESIASALSPSAYRLQAARDVAALKVQLAQEFPGATDAQIASALSSAEPVVIAGLPLGSPNSEKARGKLRTILEQALAYGRQA